MVVFVGSSFLYFNFFLPFKTWIEMIKGTYAAVESENAFCPQQLTGDAQR
jgi:hypothetical protein